MKGQASAVPAEFPDYLDSVMRVARIFWVPTRNSRDILHQAKGGSSWLSPLKSDGFWDDQAGEAGLAEP